MRFLNHIGILNAVDLQLQPWWNGRKSQGEPNVAQNVRVTHHAPNNSARFRWECLVTLRVPEPIGRNATASIMQSSRYARRMRSLQANAILEGVHSHG